LLIPLTMKGKPMNKRPTKGTANNNCYNFAVCRGLIA
jgi:hypothetical protein